MFEWPSPQEESDYVYFEGKIHNMQLLTKSAEVFHDEELNLVSDYESSFHGYFKGRFFPWDVVGSLSNIFADTLVYRSAKIIPPNFGDICSSNSN
jgi:hypothetical protein